MPGIAGIVGPENTAEYRPIVSAMLETMRHETSYKSGLHHSLRCKACVGWMAHPGSYAQCQSGVGRDGLYLAFAGEHFGNSEETDSTADIGLRQSYRDSGVESIAELNGLFSGLLLDPVKGSVLLFNDRYGCERIYFSRLGDTFYFASEAKALLKVLPGLRSFDFGGVAQVLAFGSPFPDSSLFSNIEALPAASLWTFECGQAVSRKKYFQVSDWTSQEKLSAGRYATEFTELARSVFPRYALPEKDVGISITGGLDSRMVLACLPSLTERDSDLTSYTYGPAVGDTLDTRLARTVANDIGLEHHTLRIGDTFVEGFSSYVDTTAFITDGCLGALGAHEIFLSESARSLAPVRLTGNFGSEILRSVSTLMPLGLDERLIEPSFRNLIANVQVRRTENPLVRTVFEEIPGRLYGPLAAARSKLVFRSPFLDNDVVKLAFRAPPEARNSASASLKLIASGDPRLSRVPTDRGISCGGSKPWTPIKRLYCEATFKLDYWDKEGLPAKLSSFDSMRGVLNAMGLLGLHKFLPYRLWFRNELHEYVQDVFHSTNVKQQPWWNAEFLPKVLANHASGRENYLNEINAVLTLDAIERRLINDLT